MVRCGNNRCVGNTSVRFSLAFPEVSTPYCIQRATFSPLISIWSWCGSRLSMVQRILPSGWMAQRSCPLAGWKDWAEALMLKAAQIEKMGAECNKCFIDYLLYTFLGYPLFS